MSAPEQSLIVQLAESQVRLTQALLLQTQQMERLTTSIDLLIQALGESEDVDPDEDMPTYLDGSAR